MTGRVYLVGAGPGDAQLLTLRAATLLQKAEVILYDRLVDESVLNLIPDDTKKVYVGRAVGDDTTHQYGTNDLMLQYAKSGKQVVRLKGGDPGIFGRGGEEAQFLKQSGIPYEIVPGITSGVGSAAYSGIPLTHRKHSSSVAFVTGHEDPTKDTETVRWRLLARSVDTIVIMMGLSRIRIICDELMRGGMSPDTPAVVIHGGTTRHHTIWEGTIQTIPDVVKSQNVKPPANIIIGRVASFHRSLGWR